MKSNNTPCYGIIDENESQSDPKSTVIISLPVNLDDNESKKKDSLINTKAFEEKRGGIYRESFQTYNDKSSSLWCPHNNESSHDGLQTMCKDCALKYNKKQQRSTDLIKLMNIRQSTDEKIRAEQSTSRFVAEKIVETTKLDKTTEIPKYESLVDELLKTAEKPAFGPEQLELLAMDPKELGRHELLHQFERLQQLCKMKFNEIITVQKSQQQQQQLQLQQENENSKPASPKEEVGTLIQKKKKYKPYHVSDENAIQKRTRIYRVFPEFVDAVQHDTWPKSTDVVCWWDCHVFETQPIPLPVRFRPRTNDFKVVGCFCSWNCVVAYNRNQKRPVCNSLISFMYRRVTKQKNYLKRIKPAMPREALMIFGGPLTIEQFRAKSADPTLKHSLLTAPLTMLRTEVEEVETERRQAHFQETIKEAIAAADAEAAKKRKKQKKQKKSSSTRPSSTTTKRTVTKPSKFRLRRKKPLPNEGNTLFSTMGLKVIEPSSS